MGYNYLEYERKKTSSISIESQIKENELSTIRLIYTCNQIDYNYTVALKWLPSNIGNGKIWYFICPFTQKRCRKLHLMNGRFMHRSKLPGAMYSKQIQSKKWRQIEKIYGCYFDQEKYYEQIYSKHFRKYYNGKPTKKYKRLLKEIKKAERFTVRDIEELFLMK
ncbi:hypothetical protein GUB10_11980 [Salegentibacter sp. BLCTC]|uniref:hypothetical protein n=1 Tax=Salegentibacter sp. BLCTC TaxID=2697368 RepID=UPI001D129FA2|nr:hypothetical protein [Salegentibacter sp. BLCTC]MBE7641054.1 hypothetical protein [Salegentibacter sp. BLCTC]